MSGAQEIFSDGWARVWGAEVNDNADYRRAAANWEGAVALRMTADPEMGIDEDRAVIADLWHGECRGAGSADDEALAGAPFVIRGAPATWRAILAGDLDPLLAIMRGKLKLEKGRLFSLLPYAVAARELVESARKVATRVPSAWE